MEKPQPKQLNDNKKEICCKCFEEFLEEEHIPAGKSIFYDILSEGNYINLSSKEKKEYYEKALTILTTEEMKKPDKQRKLHLLSGNRSLFITFKAKVLILEDYFAKIDADGKHLKEILI